MPLTLSWDLFVIVFFGVVVTYSFIIEKDEAVKVIIFSYTAIVSAEAVAHLMGRLTTTTNLLATLGLPLNINIIEGTKLIVFVGMIILLAIRSGFDVGSETEHGSIMNFLVTALCGFATAGLLLSTLLTFVAGAPLLSMNLAQMSTLAPIMQQSQLMQAMILYQDVWLVLPAALLVGVGIINRQ